MPPEQEKQKQSPLKQIRTFQGDVADALKTQNESVVSIQRKEQAKRSLEPEIEKDIQDDRKKLFLLILGVLVLTGLGSLVGWYAYHEFIRQTSAPVVETPPNRLVSTNMEVDIDTTLATRSTLLGLISDERAKGDTPRDEIKHLVLRTGTTTPQALLTTQGLFTILDGRIPGTLLRSFSDIFMLGTVGGEPSSHFLLIKLSSFESAFAGMLNWESQMFNDLSLLLDLTPSTSQSTTWIDMVTRNKDARALVDEFGEVGLLYSFFDNQILIITDSVQTLDTLINRLNREKLIR